MRQRDGICGRDKVGPFILSLSLSLSLSPSSSRFSLGPCSAVIAPPSPLSLFIVISSRKRNGRKDGREKSVVNGGILIGMRGAVATFCDITSITLSASSQFAILFLSNSIIVLGLFPFSLLRPPLSAPSVRFPSEYGRGRFTQSTTSSLWALPRVRVGCAIEAREGRGGGNGMEKKGRTTR